MENPLAHFPVVIKIPVQWGEMDAFGHVNNTVYFRYFESARLAYFEKIEYMEFMNESGVGPILGSTQCRFRAALTYPDTVSVGARISQIEDDRITMEYLVLSQKQQKIAAEGEGVVVSFNYREGKKAPLPEEIKQRIVELQTPTSIG